MRQLNIIAEASIPYLRGAIEELGNVTYLPSEQFTPKSIESADWLIIRSITKCHRKLLQGSQVQLITTATIGFDHIDTEYCEEEGIHWTNAPGCNAEAVGQYFGATIALLHKEEGFDPRGLKLGIVGVGHVGKVVARYAKALGMEVLLNDPPRAKAEGDEGFISLDQIAKEADIISLHVPLTKEGAFPTYHLVQKDFIQRLEKKPILINACRGGVTDTQALLWGLDKGLIDKLIIDCWENEPNISAPLLDASWLATPHIAGFSNQGKANGARKCVEEGIDFFNLKNKVSERMYPSPLSNPYISLNPDGNKLLDALYQTLDLRKVDALLRSRIIAFEEQRRNYDYPYEPSSYFLSEREIGEESENAQIIGFKVR